MNKADLINHVATAAGLIKASAGEAVEAVLGGITGGLVGGDSLSLVGFGTFSVTECLAYSVQIRRAGNAINVPILKVPKFVAAKVLKDAVK